MTTLAEACICWDPGGRRPRPGHRLPGGLAVNRGSRGGPRPVHAMACGSGADSDTPPATALARQSTSSAGDPRAEPVTILCGPRLRLLIGCALPRIRSILGFGPGKARTWWRNEYGGRGADSEPLMVRGSESAGGDGAAISHQDAPARRKGGEPPARVQRP